MAVRRRTTLEAAAPDQFGALLAPQRFEAEDFAGIGPPGFIRVKALATASAAELVQPVTGRTGIITQSLAAAAPGFYQVRVVYIDETDGVSSASITVGGQSIGAWNFDGIAGAKINANAPVGTGMQAGNFRTITLGTGFAVDASTVLSLTLTQNGSEFGRVDYIELIDVNAAPTALTLTDVTIVEGRPGAAVGPLVVTDPNVGDRFTFAVNDARFTVDANGLLKLKAGLDVDFETEPNISVTVTATDLGGQSVSNTFALTVLDRQAEIDLISLDGPLLNDRLAFSHIETTDGRADKSTATLRIANTGGDPLHIADLALSGPFAFVDPLQDAPATIAPGGFLDVAIRFDRAAYDPATDPDIFTGTLSIVSDDADESTLTVDLAGFWQQFPEKGREPDVNEVWEMFGYGNRVPVAGLNNFDIVEQLTPEEVLAPYWRLADGVSEATITWLGSWHGLVPASLGIHAPGSVATKLTLLTQTANQNQRPLPDNTAGISDTVIIDAARVPDAWAGNDVFGLLIQKESSDPTLNSAGPGTSPDPGAERGHFVRAFQALDGDGNPIANTFLIIEDYNSKSINYDYNDNMFVIAGVTPVTDPLL